MLGMKGGQARRLRAVKGRKSQNPIFDVALSTLIRLTR